MGESVGLVVQLGEFYVRLRAEGPTTVANVKEKIKELLGIEIRRQIVTYGLATLPDDKWITPPINEVYLIVLPSYEPDKILNITVKHNASDYQQVVEVKETDTVMSVKEKIVASSEFKAMVVAKKIREKGEQIVAKDLELWRKLEKVEMTNELPLVKYFIHEGCKIDVKISVIDRKVSEPAEGKGKGKGKEEGETSTQFELHL